MIQLQEPKVFKDKREFFYFLSLLLLILFYSTLIRYEEYKNFTHFNSAIVDAEVLKSYTKTKKSKHYQILKLKADRGFVFYTKASKKLDAPFDKKLTLKLYVKHISFYEYLTSFYAYSKILKVKKLDTIKQKLNSFIASTHSSSDITNIYQALFSAKPLPKELQQTFSSLGISHLFAISGFHLSVLSAFLFFLLKPLYKLFQNRFFPYRSSKKDLFVAISFILLAYIIFLDTPPSLLRSFSMLLVGFILYDRGFKIISMQTLFLSVCILLSFDIKLFFSLGFWLSVAGVFYIFLFFMLFVHLGKTLKFILLPIWVYITMLPYSIAIFHNFSIYHPLSIIWTLLFSFFYPFSIVMHLVGLADIMDSALEQLLLLNKGHIEINFSMLWLYGYMALSFVSALVLSSTMDKRALDLKKTYKSL
jgi:competence protein ComEC